MLKKRNALDQVSEHYVFFFIFLYFIWTIE